MKITINGKDIEIVQVHDMAKLYGNTRTRSVSVSIEDTSVTVDSIIDMLDNFDGSFVITNDDSSTKEYTNYPTVNITNSTNKYKNEITVSFNKDK